MAWGLLQPIKIMRLREQNEATTETMSIFVDCVDGS